MKSINEQEQNFLDILRAVPAEELQRKQRAIQEYRTGLETVPMAPRGSHRSEMRQM
eukprot:gene34890-46870_t